MKIQNFFALVLALGVTASAFPADARSSGGGGRSGGGSVSRSFGSSPTRSTSTPSFGSSNRTSSNGTKSTGASAFSSGPSTATKAVATSKAQSLNSSAKPLTQSQLASSGVKTAKPSELGMSSADTTRLSAMQTQHNALQSIPVAQRNDSNPVFVQQRAAYDRDRLIVIQNNPTTYIPMYGTTSSGPYYGGYVNHVVPADDASGVENFFKGFLTFLLWMCGLGLGGYSIYKLISFAIERNEEIKAQKARIEEAKKRF
jgi:hypothetical protein